MALFQQNPSDVFPFLVENCDALVTGARCELHAFDLGGSGFPGDLHGGNVGIVEVASTPTPVLFTVVSDEYFDNAGSTIEFRMSERDGRLILTQTASGTTDDRFTEYFTELGASGLMWGAQAWRVRTFIDDHR